jgi:uncharacterized protein
VPLLDGSKAMSHEMNLESIINRIRREMPFLVERYKVKSLGIFGSYVRRHQHAGSDLDLLVTFWEVPGLLQFIELENYLSDCLEIKIDPQVSHILTESG